MNAFFSLVVKADGGVYMLVLASYLPYLTLNFEFDDVESCSPCPTSISS